MGGYRIAPSGGGGGGGAGSTWTRFLLNSGSTKTDPGGGATVTVNGESPWSDITQPAQNEKEPADLTTWNRQLFDPADGVTPLVWSDLFVISVQLEINQWSDTGTSSGYGQNIAVYLANTGVPSTAAHYYYGGGLYNLDATRIKLLRLWGADGSAVPTFTIQQIKSSGWTANSRLQMTLANSIQGGPNFSILEYRQFNNTAKQTGWADMKGVTHDSGLSPYWTASSDNVYMGLYFPGINSTSSMAITNMEFKASYSVMKLTQDATA